MSDIRRAIGCVLIAWMIFTVTLFDAAFATAADVDNAVVAKGAAEKAVAETAALDLTVLDPDGKPAAGKARVLFADSDPKKKIRTDKQGKVRVEYPADAKYLSVVINVAG